MCEPEHLSTEMMGAEKEPAETSVPAQKEKRQQQERPDEISDEADEKQCQGCGGCIRGLVGPGKWRKLMTAFCTANNIQPEDVQNRFKREKEAQARGFNLAENSFERLLNAKLSDRSHSKNCADKNEKTPNKKKEKTGGDQRSGKSIDTRAQCYTRITEKVYEFAPGQTIATEVDIRNATH